MTVCRWCGEHTFIGDVHPCCAKWQRKDCPACQESRGQEAKWLRRSKVCADCDRRAIFRGKVCEPCLSRAEL